MPEDRHSVAAARVYLVLCAASAFGSSLVFAVNLLYQTAVVGLDPLQLVLVGTCLEATALVFEIPTGVVADLVSRKLSIIIGYVLIGAGFVLEGSVPRFAAILAAQVLWGVGYIYDGLMNAAIPDSSVRSTLLSACSQANAVGQITGGPLAGFAGRLWSVRAGLLASALLLLPAPAASAALLRRTLRAGDKPQPG